LPDVNIRYGFRHPVVYDITPTRFCSTTISILNRTTLLRYCGIRGNAESSVQYLAYSLMTRLNVTYLLQRVKQIVEIH
jgi:hypothetical protein